MARLAFLLPDMRGGGAERVALILAQDFVGRGHHVDLLLREKAGELLDLLPPEVRVVDLAAPRIRGVVGPLVRYLRDSRPDGIQAFMWPLTITAILAHRIARSKARLVLSDHIMLTSQYGPPSRAYPLLRLTTRLFYPLANSRVIISHQAADDLARLSGLPRDGIEVIYNPVPGPPAGTATTPEVESLWVGDGPRIISVGKFKEQKNQALLIRAFARFARNRPGRLMILGEGELRRELTELAETEGVADRVVLPGFFADPWPFYASADLFALSSDYEGYPLVLIEALRSGLRIVSTDCPSGPREILDGSRYGRLVPCGDAAALAEAMEEALAQPADPARLDARAEALSGRATADRYLELMAGSGA